MLEPCSQAKYKSLSASVFAAFVAIGNACLFAWVKQPITERIFFDLFSVIAVSFFLLFGPHVVLRLPGLKKFKENVALNTFCSQPLVLTVLFFLIMAVASIPIAGVLVSLLGLASAIYGGCCFFKFSQRLNTTLIVIFAILLSLFLGSHLYSGRFNLPIFLEYLSIGKTHIDTLYHVALANMLKVYHIPSTGLDGLPLLNYHFGSHWVFAKISTLLSLNMMDTYLMTFPVIFIPLFIQCFLNVVFSLQKYLTESQKEIMSFNKANLIIWPFFFLSVVGFLPEDAQSKLLLNLMLVFGSQSYIVAMIFLFVFIAILLDHPLLWKKDLWQKDSPFSLSHKILLVIFLPCLLAFMGLCKISVGIVALLVLIYFLLRYRILNSFYLLSAIISSLLLLIVYKYGNSIGSELVFEKFNFFNEVIGSTKPFVPFFFIFYYGWTFIYTGWVYLESRSNGKTFFSELKAGKFPLLELLWVSAAVSLLPVNLVDIIGRSEFYFVDIQPWLALFVLFASLPIIFQSKTFQFVLSRIVKFKIEKIVVSIVLIASLLVVQQSFVRASKEITKLQSEIKNEHALNDPKLLETELILKFLKELDQRPILQKRKTLVFIPKTLSAYWGILANNENKYPCQTAPYILPALTGFAMINGLPEASCPLGQLRFESYQMPTHQQTPQETTPKYLCPRVKKLGFSQLMILKDVNHQIQAENHNCNEYPAKLGIH